MTPVGRSFDTDDAAEYLSIHRETLLKAYRAGKVRGVKDTLRSGNPIRFWKDDLDAYRDSKLVANVE